MQFLLAARIVPDSAIVEHTGRHRSTVCRWRKGDTKPAPEDARRLVTLFSGHPVEIAGRRYKLDMEGCYEPALVREELWRWANAD